MKQIKEDQLIAERYNVINEDDDEDIVAGMEVAEDYLRPVYVGYISQNVITWRKKEVEELFEDLELINEESYASVDDLISDLKYNQFIFGLINNSYDRDMYDSYIASFSKDELMKEISRRNNFQELKSLP